jgi:hypothetical protein
MRDWSRRLCWKLVSMWVVAVEILMPAPWLGVLAVATVEA